MEGAGCTRFIVGGDGDVDVSDDDRQRRWDALWVWLPWDMERRVGSSNRHWRYVRGWQVATSIGCVIASFHETIATDVVISTTCTWSLVRWENRVV